MGSFKENFAEKKKTKIASIILYALLIFAIIMLCLELLNYQKPSVTLDPTVSDDGILETNSPSLKIHYAGPTESLRLNVRNMMPGDSLMKMYTVEVFTKGDTNLFFRVNPVDKDNKLSEVLSVTVFYSDNDEVVYDGPIKYMPSHVKCPIGTVSDDRNVSAVNLELTFYQHGESVGNEYQAQTMEATLDFWVEDTSVLYLPGVSELDIGIFTWATVVAVLCAIIYLLAFIVFKAITKMDKKDQENIG